MVDRLFQYSSAKRQSSIGVFLCLCLCAAAWAEAEFAAPSALAEWKDPAYTRRFFIRVSPVGEAGDVGLHKDPQLASLLLPLKLSDDVSGRQPESILLLDEEGAEQPVLSRPAPGGKEVEIAFPTRPASRRFCLYAGAPEGVSKRASPPLLHPEALRVIIRGRSAPLELAYQQAAPLTLERFLKIEARPDGVLGIHNAQNINDAECPFLAVTVDQLGHTQQINNPKRYMALYEGFLRTPVKGRYKFALDTPGAAQLLIDGQSVLSAEKPDLERPPFTLHNSVLLTDGLHRLVLYYAEANTPASKSNADCRRFGLRLHWQPPFARSLMCIPAQAFPRALPAAVVHYEESGNLRKPFIHIENLGQVRTGSYLGEQRAREYVLLAAKAVNAPPGAYLDLCTPTTGYSGDTQLCHWVPAGVPIKLVLWGAKGELAARPLLFPTANNGARDVLDLESELAIKSAPEFLFPDETGNIHLETLLSPPPVLIPKERRENKLLPPEPRPMGEYWLTWQISDQSSNPPTFFGCTPATPLEGSRKKLRISVPAAELAQACKSGRAQLVLKLSVGDVNEMEVEQVRFRLLYSQSKSWPGTLRAGADRLFLDVPGSAGFQPANEGGQDGRAPRLDNASLPLPAAALAESGLERVLIVLPRQSELAHRAFAALKFIARGNLGTEALFLGDPLVEVAQPPPAGNQQASEAQPQAAVPQPAGLGARLMQAYPAFTWKSITVAGPHRYLPIFRMLAGLDAYMRAQPEGKLPALVVVSLGGGDVARQTPLHNFERALDVLLDRLCVGGAQKIFIVGVLPEPEREKQCQPYQERVLDVQRQHHVDGLDLFDAWTTASGWARRYALEGFAEAPVYGPVPNSQALDEIIRMIKNEL